MGATINSPTRFWAKVDRRGANECWPWMAYRRAGGYGQFSLGHRSFIATHFALEMDGRPRPTPSSFALHSCDRPECVNPSHLRWGSQAENIAEAAGKRRLRRMGEPVCIKGHAKTPANTYTYQSKGRTRRQCLICSRQRGRVASLAHYHRAVAIKSDATRG